MSLKKIGFLFTLSLTVFNDSYAQLTGPRRIDFIEGATNSCFKTQRAAPVNSNMSNTDIFKYCKCATTYIADLLHNRLADDIENGYQKINPVWGNMAAQYCQKNFNKY